MCICIMCIRKSPTPPICVLFSITMNTFKTYLCKRDSLIYLASQAGLVACESPLMQLYPK